MNFTKTLLTVLILFSGIYYSGAQNNITITDEASHNAHESSVLDVYSTSKGMLIPRMTTDQRVAVADPAIGLLVFDTDELSFFFFSGSDWQNLSGTGGNLWSINGSTGDVYLNEIDKKVGIGTNDPISKLAVVANSGSNPEDPLFEIQDEFGLPIFSVSSEGVRIYVKDIDSKGVSGGFAVGRYGAAKGIPDTTFLLVTGDSTRVYMKESTGKGVSGGFAVGRYGAAKGTEEYLRVTPDSTRVYTANPGKGVSGGFAVGRYGAAKEPASSYLHLTRNNYLIGHRAGDSLTTGLYNIFLGYESGISDSSGNNNSFFGYQTGYKNLAGSNNLFLGYQSGYSNMGGSYNSFMGYWAGYSNTIGSQNSFLGSYSGITNTTGSNNTFSGFNSGYSNIDGEANNFYGTNSGFNNQSGSNNIFIGPESGYLNVAGSFNTFMGYKAGYSNTADYNVFLGFESGTNNTSGNKDVFIGYQAGRSNTYGSSNVYIGDNAGFTNQGGEQNVYIGTNAGYTGNGDWSNVFIGYESGYSTTISLNNVFIGTMSGHSTTWGESNVYIGNQAGRDNVTGSSNVCIGVAAGQSSSSGSNVLIGFAAGWDNTSGAANVFLGNQAGWSNTTGGDNIYIGSGSAYQNEAGDGNIFIGKYSGWSELGSNRLYIENSNSPDPLIYGQFDNDRVGINDGNPSANLHVKQVGTGEEGFAIENDANTNTWSYEILFTWLGLYYNGSMVGYWDDATGNYIATSDKNLKKDIEYMDQAILDRVMKLKPATYRLMHTDENDQKNIGFIAQEVQEYFPELIYQETEDSHLSLHYPDFGILAIKAIQEQQDIITGQEERIRKLEEDNSELKKKINEIFKLIEK